MAEEEKKDKKKKASGPDDEPPIEEDVEFLGKPPKRKETRITYFRKSFVYNNLDPPLPKPGKKFEKEEKIENELVRQFRVSI